MINAVNLDHSTTDVDTNSTKAQPSILSRFTSRLLSTRNKVSASVLEQMLPDTVEESKQGEVIGGILEYDGPTVMIEPDEEEYRLGLEVRAGDLIFATMSGVWIGVDHYSDMPAAIEEYNFLTSGTRDEYNDLVEQKLQGDLSRHNEVMEYLMVA